MVEQEPPVSDDQLQVLQMAYDGFRERGTWTTFGDVDRPLRRLGLKPEAIIESIPRDLLMPFDAGRAHPVASDELRLTLKGVAACAGGEEDIDAFLRLVPWLAERELAFQPDSEHPDASLRVAGSEIRDFLQLPDEPTGIISRLRKLITLQRWGWAGGELASGEWYVQVDRSIDRVGGVRTLDDYLEVVARWEAETKRSSWIPEGFRRPLVSPMGIEHTPSLQVDTYVSASLVAALEAAAADQSRWNCEKLLQLIYELNDSHARGNTYSAHAMLRAILDHVPPIFGYRDFKEIVSNYSWGQTDQRYTRRLLDFKDQGHDVLHRQIAASPDVLRIEDMPAAVLVNRLLLECSNKLTSQ